MGRFMENESLDIMISSIVDEEIKKYKNGVWNIILHKLDENTYVPSDNQPKESGRYLCTCVSFYDGEETGRYLEILRYDVERKCWHDIGNPYGISHNILAWTEGIDICEFDNYEKYGSILIEKSE